MKHPKPFPDGNDSFDYRLEINNMHTQRAKAQMEKIHETTQLQLSYLKPSQGIILLLLLGLVIVLPIVATKMSGNIGTLTTISVGVAIIALIVIAYSLHSMIRSHEAIYGARNPEKVKWSSRLWRNPIQAIIKFRADPVNRPRLRRLLEVSVPQLQPLEGYHLDRFIGALETDDRIPFFMKQAFKNKNLGRIIVQALPQFDILWHNSTRLEWVRILDFVGNFPATEIQADTFGNVLRLLFRDLLGRGKFWTRYLTNNRQELITDGGAEEIASQNLAVGSAFESASRATHGALIGRDKVYKFRAANRLPADESIVRNFNASPSLTIADNGFEHVVNAVVKHWRYTLNNPAGNFAHQRQELLDPVNSMQIILPAVLTQMIALRGINIRDKKIVAAYIKKLELIEPQPGYSHLIALLQEFQKDILEFVCGGVPSRLKPLKAWVKALMVSCKQLEKRAKEVIKLVESVEPGIHLGITVIQKTDWAFPSDTELKEIIFGFVKDPASLDNEEFGISKRMMESALDKLAPKDKRTFYEFIDKKVPNPRHRTMFAFLIKRVRSLLKREILRFRFSAEIQKMETEMKVPVGGMIADAQKAWMMFELDHLQKFSINSFLDHSHLRPLLRALQVVSELQCTALDEAKITNLMNAKGSTKLSSAEDLKVGEPYWFQLFPPRGAMERLTLISSELKEGTFVFKSESGEAHQRSWLQQPGSAFPGLKDVGIFRTAPQNMLVLGGGPTGMLTALHALENVIRAGGTMTLSEKRDAYESGGSGFSRAQVVRLDPRWIAMIRYHVGTRFEDVFVPLDGETMAHLSNFLVDMGFVELTTKQLEVVLQYGVALRRSAGLLNYHTESPIEYKWQTHTARVRAKHLKAGYALRDFTNPETKRTYDHAIVTNVELPKHSKNLSRLQKGARDSKMPSAETHQSPHRKTARIHIECFDNTKGPVQVVQEAAEDVEFLLDISSTNVISAKGKGAHSYEAFRVSTYENYGVVCLSGAKVSHLMHQMGVPRWKNSLVNDIRSVVEDNTRLIGDFTKVISTPKIAEMMAKYTELPDWRDAAKRELGTESKQFNRLHQMLWEEVKAFTRGSRSIYRQQLQARVFETGDNSYVGMEVPREFKRWQEEASERLEKAYLVFGGLSANFKKNLTRFVAKLFFQGALDVLGSGDVFNPGAKSQIPPYMLVDSAAPVPLRELCKGDAFQVHENTDGPLEKGLRYELISRGKGWLFPTPYVVRDMQGRISLLRDAGIQVRKAGDLTRAPDGETESKVAFSTFPVAHYVNHSAMRVVDREKGLVYVPVGDAQSTPHFMRYSGLTGAAINAMEMAKFAGGLAEGKPFDERFQEYRRVINWSNHEVVTRGTGNNYGEDGFLRPGFSYKEFIKYLFNKVDEYTDHDEAMLEPTMMFSPNWLKKFGSAFVPRGLEANQVYQKALTRTLEGALESYLQEVKETDAGSSEDELQRKARIARESFKVILEYVKEEAKAGKRISSECSNQPKPLDSIADNQGPEVQAFIAGFTISAAFAAAGLASSNMGLMLGPIPLSSILGGIVSPILAFGSVANASRYLRRHEDLQTYFVDKKLNGVKQALVAGKRRHHERLEPTRNPFTKAIKEKLEAARKLAEYDGLPLEHKFVESVEELWTKTDDEGLATRVQEVMNDLLGRLIPATYDELTYTKDALAELVQALKNLREATIESEGVVSEAQKKRSLDIDDILDDIDVWEPRIRDSLEKGKVSYGLFRSSRSWANSHIARLLAHFRSFLPGWLPFSTISQQTKSIIKSMRGLSSSPGDQFVLDKELRDLEEFYYSTVEVHKSNLIMIAGIIGGIVAFIQNILVLAGKGQLTYVLIFVAVLSPIPPIVAVIFLMKQQQILIKRATCFGLQFGTVDGLHGYIKAQLEACCGEKDLERERSALERVAKILRWNFLVNLARILGAATVAVALVCTLAATDLVAPLALAGLISLLVAFLGTLHIVYNLYYNLDERDPKFICDAFKDKITEIYDHFLKTGCTYAASISNRLAWEYTARKFLHIYRFDIILDASRVNSMLQYIQSGMDLGTKGLPKKLPSPDRQLRDLNSQPSLGDVNSEPSLLPERVEDEHLEPGKLYYLFMHGQFISYRFERQAGNQRVFKNPVNGSELEIPSNAVSSMTFHRPDTKASSKFKNKRGDAASPVELDYGNKRETSVKGTVSKVDRNDALNKAEDHKYRWAPKRLGEFIPTTSFTLPDDTTFTNNRESKHPESMDDGVKFNEKKLQSEDMVSAVSAQNAPNQRLMISQGSVAAKLDNLSIQVNPGNPSIYKVVSNSSLSSNASKANPGNPSIYKEVSNSSLSSNVSKGTSFRVGSHPFFNETPPTSANQTPLVSTRGSETHMAEEHGDSSKSKKKLVIRQRHQQPHDEHVQTPPRPATRGDVTAP